MSQLNHFSFDILQPFKSVKNTVSSPAKQRAGSGQPSWSACQIWPVGHSFAILDQDPVFFILYLLLPLPLHTHKKYVLSLLAEDFFSFLRSLMPNFYFFYFSKPKENNEKIKQDIEHGLKKRHRVPLLLLPRCDLLQVTYPVQSPFHKYYFKRVLTYNHWKAFLKV